MREKNYTISRVQPEEYRILKEKESQLIEKIFEELSNPEEIHNLGIQILIKYNYSRKKVGIFLNKNQREDLILNDEDLTNNEKTIVNRLYSKLKRKLDYIRMPNEEWIEYLENKIDYKEDNLKEATEENPDDDIPF